METASVHVNLETVFRRGKFDDTWCVRSMSIRYQIALFVSIQYIGAILLSLRAENKSYYSK